MTDSPEEVVERIPLDDENDRFFERFQPALFELYDSVRAKNELDFVRTIAADLWGAHNVETSIAAESQMFFNDYMMYFDQVDFTRLNLMIALGFYCRLARGTGFYEVIANLLAIDGGGRYREWPFDEAPADQSGTGTGDVLRDLADLAERNGRTELAGLLSRAFNGDLVSSYLRADLLLRDDGLHLLRKGVGEPSSLTLAEFHAYFERGITFYEVLREATGRYQTKYSTSKKIRGRLDDGPEQEHTVRFDLRKRTLEIAR